MKDRIRNGLVATAVIIVLSPMVTPAVTQTADRPTNVRGTITNVDGNTIEINGRNGPAKVHLADNTEVTSVAKATLSDIKPGSFIGTAATPRTDGTLQAIEIHIFPESMRGTGEGSYAWDTGTKSTMTNGTVAQRPGRVSDNKVSKVEGSNLTVDYNGGSRVVTATPDTRVVTLVPGDRSELKPNTRVFIPGATKAVDGVLQANRITVGRDGIAPPM